MSQGVKNLICLVVLVLAVAVAKRGPLVAPRSESPISEPGLHVLMIEDTAHRTPDVGAVIYSQKWQSLVGTGNWRHVDPIDDEGRPTDFSQLEPKWRAALARPRAVLPWVIISNAPYGGYEGPLVASQLIPLVEKWSQAGQ